MQPIVSSIVLLYYLVAFVIEHCIHLIENKPDHCGNETDNTFVIKVYVVICIEVA